MKVLVVTSEVTFVPDNYDQLIVRLAELPQVGGLVILRNWNKDVFLKALGSWAVGARDTGRQLLLNGFGDSTQRRHDAYRAKGKPVWMMDTLNCNDALEIVKLNGFDLILNARTRCIYKTPILMAPSIGCVNVHHGLLPEQRGTMCDLWALSESRPAGFSLHKMSEKIDDGDILLTCEVDGGGEKRFSDYLARSARMEFDAVKQFLTALEITGCLSGTPNVSQQKRKHFRNPEISDIKRMKKEGMKL